MAIDYRIEYDCIPKNALTAAGILERLKEKQRADEVIRWFREHGDSRPPAEMGFRFNRRSPGETGAEQVIVVQDLLDRAAELEPLAPHCRGCPANRSGAPFGCIGFIRYPISAAAETWLMDRLPVPDEPLIWLLLRQGIRQFGYDGAAVKALRDGENDERTYFELPVAPQRRLGEFWVSADQMLEMILGVGERIHPNHGGILLLFFDAIERRLEADEIRDISASDGRRQAAFTMRLEAQADAGQREFFDFFRALHLAWTLNVPLYVDA